MLREDLDIYIMPMHSLQNVSRINIGRLLMLCIMLTKCQMLRQNWTLMMNWFRVNE